MYVNSTAVLVHISTTNPEAPLLQRRHANCCVWTVAVPHMLEHCIYACRGVGRMLHFRAGDERIVTRPTTAAQA
jgi:hypothetical protein